MTNCKRNEIADAGHTKPRKGGGGMAFWLWGAGASAVVAVLLLMSRLTVRVRYSRSGRLDQLVVLVKGLYGLYRYRFVLPTIALEGPEIVFDKVQAGGLAGSDGEKKSRFALNRRTYAYYAGHLRELLASVRQFRGWLGRFARRIECTRWRLDFAVGTGDAAATATAAGLFWTISGMAAGLTGRFVRLAAVPDSRVKPNFAAPEFGIVWEADFRIRLGAICWSMLALLGRVRHLRIAVRACRQLAVGPRRTQDPADAT